MLTGEVRPVAVAPGDDVYGSTLNEALLTGGGAAGGQSARR